MMRYAASVAEAYARSDLRIFWVNLTAFGVLMLPVCKLIIKINKNDYRPTFKISLFREKNVEKSQPL